MATAPPSIMAQVEEGIMYIFNLWPAMRMAVENDFAEDGQSGLYAMDMAQDTAWVLLNSMLYRDVCE